MRKLLFLFVISAFLSSCADKVYVQVYELRPKWENKSYANIFENDTVRIEYSFWSKYGKFSFSLFNKLNAPMYIDWKNSSLIINGNKLDYWSDELVTNSHTAGRMKSNVVFGTMFTNSEGVSTSITTKQEKITFVPPQSTIYKVQFDLVENKPLMFKGDKFISEEIIASYNPKKKVATLYETYEEGNSELKFRNYMTLSTSENFSNRFSIDNGFYLQRVTQMSVGHFFGTAYPASLPFNEMILKYKSNYEDRLRFFITTIPSR